VRQPQPGRTGPGTWSRARAQAAAPATFPPAIQRQFQQALDQTLADPTVPGAIVGIWVPGRGTWIHAAGLADRATKRPMQVQDYTRIGSMTKTFIGTLILPFVGEGKLGLDDPIQRWVPQVPNAQHITVRELLNMSSGHRHRDRRAIVATIAPGADFPQVPAAATTQRELPDFAIAQRSERRWTQPHIMR
jgi:D-alanyl-D-alanine carboxypeptidase